MLQWLAGVSVVLLVTVGLFAVDYFRNNLDRHEFARLKKENRSQQMELQRLVASLQDLRQEMVVLAQNDAKGPASWPNFSKPRSDTPRRGGRTSPGRRVLVIASRPCEQQIDGESAKAIDLRRRRPGGGPGVPQ
ncbi:hypothetical protein JCM30471_13860 [Desulfuromonas carbonis]